MIAKQYLQSIEMQYYACSEKSKMKRRYLPDSYRDGVNIELLNF